MIPLLANQHDWGFVCGRVNILEGQMLPQSFYMGLLAQERWDDVLRQLQGLPLESTLTPDLAWDN
ncbi:MAG: hypothetical protein HYZ00_06830, partial [Candidatus Hydrogenedentes bacterium]|nr:hypothetical protein [Candidatus Hydrogenedentota bacterium]